MLAVAVGAVAVTGPLLFILFFFRSTKEFPKSWREAVIELKTIWCGYTGQNEDWLRIRRNRVSKLMN